MPIIYIDFIDLNPRLLGYKWVQLHNCDWEHKKVDGVTNILRGAITY